MVTLFNSTVSQFAYYSPRKKENIINSIISSVFSNLIVALGMRRPQGDHKEEDRSITVRSPSPSLSPAAADGAGAGVSTVMSLPRLKIAPMTISIPTLLLTAVLE